ncbi:hypothetical protein FHS96_004991 [Sphingomonas zeicaulis]|uniref:hypothetical protein n=1 Tax=Sphingomonas zeicaulis TaxID=1632740 RepID=UPI003D243042
MSLADCIVGMVDRGEITAAQAEKMQARFDALNADYLKRGYTTDAAAKASEETLRQLQFEALLKKRQALLQVQAQGRIAGDLASFDGDPFTGALAVLDSDGRAPFINVEAQRRAILGRAHAVMTEALFRHSRDLLGRVRDRTGLRDVVRERFGEDTGNAAAREVAEAFGKTADMLRSRFNAAGGAIGHRADWGLPQAHDNVRVRAAGYEAWRDFTAPLLDAGRMVDEATGAPFTPEGLELALREVWESIRTDGWNRRTEGAGFAGKLANRRSDSRFLLFRNADDWLTYQDRFGTGTAWDAMLGHMQGMSRDIALLEVLGPNPAATKRWLQDRLQKLAALDPNPSQKRLDRARAVAKQFDDLYDVVTGKLGTPVNGRVARAFGGVRSFLTAAKLGSAAISATTDVGFQAVTRRFNGLPVVGAMTGYLKLLNPAAGADRRTAVRLGLIAEEASKMASALHRYIDESASPEIAKRMSDAVLRVSGLSAWTQAGRWAFGMEVLGHLGDQVGKQFDDLDPSLRGMMQRYGIEADDWDVMRATPLYEADGSLGKAQFLRPEDIGDEVLGDTLLRMVLTETDYAVPTATARARATLSFGQQPGTLGGEIIRNAALFKSFGVSMLLTHGARMMQRPNMSGRLAYFAGLTVTTGLLGGLALQMKELAKGRDPRDMGSEEFWGAALLQGGGFGIFGDFFTATENRFGGGLAETLAGPVVSAASDAAKVTIGNAMKAARGEPEKINAGRDTVKLLKNYTPGGSIWYLRAAYERMVLDVLAQEIDPDYYESWQRMEDVAAEQGQGYWWRPGENAPSRLPEQAEAPQ